MANTNALEVDEFSVHFMDGYWGRDYAGDSDLHKDAYGRGYETSERESALAMRKEIAE